MIQTHKHTMSCPICENQKEFLVEFASNAFGSDCKWTETSSTTVQFTCCKAWTVTLLKRRNPNMTTDIVAMWNAYRPGAKLPRYTDYTSWDIMEMRNGCFRLVDEYGEFLSEREYFSRKCAERDLNDMVAEEIDAREQHGPEGDPMDGVEFPFAANH